MTGLSGGSLGLTLTLRSTSLLAPAAGQMGADAKEAFGSKGIRYVRHYPSENSTHPMDVYDFFKTKSYQSMFHHVPGAANNATAVEMACEGWHVRDGM